AVRLSVEKYCSALAMLNKTAAVTHSWEIEN
ncbi:MAG: peroxiredoxin, partial [Betaproteobacteria bacterium]|nr:peroxiredoxin [Betaproteobacteria bacterium]